MEVLALIVLLALFLASGQRRLFGGDQAARRIALKDLIWR
jgi:hypothetical protein